MKKFLSLVMALALTVSLFTISAGAKDFTDKSTVNYKEAVDVISALGVVGGYSDGSFAPTGTLTRGAAAKIICNLVLGPTTGSSLGVNSAPFKDVSTSNVFAGYIAYCSQQKIINGYADGTFKPAATVTGFQFMKMLLGALGYDGSVEGFTGSNWTVAVAKLAVSIGLDDGNDNFVGSKAMTREEAALYAYNTLNATMVEYDTTGTTIVVGGTTITQGASKASEVKNSATASTQTIKHDAYMQFGEKYFKDLKKTSDTDAFGRSANTWTYKTTSVGTYAKAADATYTAEVKLGTIYSDLGLGKTIAASNITYYVNGVTKAVSDDANYTYISKGDTNHKIGGNGIVTDVYYDSDAGTITVTMVNTYAGEVKGVHAATSAKDAYINVSPAVSGVGASGTFDTTDSFAVDDVVLYTYSNMSGNDGVQSVVKAEQVTGSLTSYTSGKSVVVGGTTYKANASYASKVTDLNNAVGYDVTLTLDKYGYVLNVDTDKATGNYAVILKHNTSGSSLSDMARLLFTDGTTKDVVLKDTTIGDSVANNALNNGDIVSYTINSNSEYKLALKGDSYTSATGKATEKGSASVQPAFNKANASQATTLAGFNGKTIFLVKDSSNKYAAYTGIANVPTVNATAGITVAAYAKDSSNVATVVYIDASANATVTSASKDVVFVKGSTVGQSYDSTKGNYYTYTAVVKGEVTTIDTVTYTPDDTLYTGISYDNNKVATLSSPVNAGVGNAGSFSAGALYTINGTKAESNGVIGIGNTYYTYADDCKVFVKNTDGDISASSISAITDDGNDLVFVKFVDNEASTIVIVEKADSTTPAPVVGTYATGVNSSVGNASNLALSNASVTIVGGKDTLRFNAASNVSIAQQIKDAMAYLKYTGVTLSVAAGVYTIKATSAENVAVEVSCDGNDGGADVTYFYPVTVDNALVAYANGTTHYTFPSALTGTGNGYIWDNATAGTYLYHAYDAATVSAAHAVAIKTGYVAAAFTTTATDAIASATAYKVNGTTVASAPSYLAVGDVVTMTITLNASVQLNAASTYVGAKIGAGADATSIVYTGDSANTYAVASNVLTFNTTSATNSAATDTITITYAAAAAGGLSATTTYVAATHA